MMDTLLVRDLHAQAREHVCSEPRLNEQRAHSESKKKWNKKYKLVEGGQIEKLDQMSDAELRKGKKNSLIDVKQSEAALKIDSNLETQENACLESGLNKQLALSERKRKTKKSKMGKSVQIEKLDQKSDPELGKGKHNLLIDVKQIELELKEGENSLMKDTLLDRDSNGESLETSGVDGLKVSQLSEQLADQEMKRKSKKKPKMAKAGQFEKLDAKSGLVYEKQSGAYVESKRIVGFESKLKKGVDSDALARENATLESGLQGTQLNEQTNQLERKRKTKKKKIKMGESGQIEKLDHNFDAELGKGKQNSLVDVKQIELGLEEGANTLMKDTVMGRDSRGESLENSGLESGLKMIQLSDQPVDQGMKRKRKKKPKMAKSGQFEKLDAKSVLVGEKRSGPHVESKMIIGFESKLKEGKNSEVLARENASLESGLEGTQVNEQTDQLEKKRKRNRERRRKRREAQERRLRLLESNNVSSKSNDGDNNEAEKEHMCPKTQRTDRKDYRREDNMSILENIESNVKKNSRIPVEKIDTPRTASAVDGDIVMAEVKDKKTFQVRKKGKKSSKHVLDNGIIETSINHLEMEHTTSTSEIRGSERKQRKKLKESFCKYPDQKVVEIETRVEELSPSPSNLLVGKVNIAQTATDQENDLSQTLLTSLQQICISHPKKKLLVLDLNGILVDVVEKAGRFKPDIRVSKKAVFRRPFCDDFLNFCFRTFNVGIWSSRIDKNVNRLVDFLMRKWRHNLLFCFHRAQCTITKFKTIEDKRKPLVLKELRKIWENHLLKGEYDETNTLLLDDSPYKALRNPANTAIFPYPYKYNNAKDSSLAPCGDIRRFLEGLAVAENVQKYVEQNPFGQPAITKANPHWGYYRQILDGET